MLIEVLKKIRLDPETRLYSAVEAGSKYVFDQGMLESLKKYLDNDARKLIADWYRGLSDAERSTVKKSRQFG